MREPFGASNRRTKRASPRAPTSRAKMTSCDRDARRKKKERKKKVVEFRRRWERSFLVRLTFGVNLPFFGAGRGGCFASALQPFRALGGVLQHRSPAWQSSECQSPWSPCSELSVGNEWMDRLRCDFSSSNTSPGAAVRLSRRVISPWSLCLANTLLLALRPAVESFVPCFVSRPNRRPNK